jgi:hypothetical protein
MTAVVAGGAAVVAGGALVVPGGTVVVAGGAPVVPGGAAVVACAAVVAGGTGTAVVTGRPQGGGWGGGNGLYIRPPRTSGLYST